MTHTNADPQISSFVIELRRALHYLYDWTQLGGNSLVSLFGMTHLEEPSSALRQVLIDAIESLKPNTDVPPRAHAWRIYHVLCSRYIEQFTQKETAAELGLSIRQIRREENAALEALASYLWRHYDLASKWQGLLSQRRLAETETAATGIQTPSQEQELEYLEGSLPSETVDARQLIHNVLELVSPLAHTSNVQLEWAPIDGLPPLVVQLTTIRQALLILLTSVIRSVPGGQISIWTQAGCSHVNLTVHFRGSNGAPGPGIGDPEKLEMARQLIELSCGSLKITSDPEGANPTDIQITLPAAEQLPVLVIDDNADTLRLLRRYLSNSRFCFIGTSDPQQAVRLASELSPRIIVLDVMLPGIDGWELLGRLHEHPQIDDVPILVCTILPQEQLALSLGAADFIRKPISRQAFLSALDRQVA